MTAPRHPAQPPAIRTPERVEGGGVHLRDVVGGFDRARERHDDADPTRVRGGRHGDRVAQVGRAVEIRLVRGPHRPGHDDRLRVRPRRGPRRRPSPRSCRSPARRRPRRRRGRPVPRRCPRQIANSSANAKWLAGVRPRSIGTTSAMASRPGVRARIAAPSRAGTFPPGLRVERHADRAAGEHDDDAGHGPGVRRGRADRPDRGPPRCPRRRAPGPAWAAAGRRP